MWFGVSPVMPTHQFVHRLGTAQVTSIRREYLYLDGCNSSGGRTKCSTRVRDSSTTAGNLADSRRRRIAGPIQLRHCESRSFSAALTPVPPTFPLTSIPCCHHLSLVLSTRTRTPLTHTPSTSSSSLSSIHSLHTICSSVSSPYSTVSIYVPRF